MKSHIVGICCVFAMMSALVGCPDNPPPKATSSPPGDTDIIPMADAGDADGFDCGKCDEVEVGPPPSEKELAERAEQTRKSQEAWEAQERKRQEAVEAQARVFRDATTTIHSVYNYAGPLRYRPSNPAKLIGVDIELEGFTESFYLHCLQVVDGVTGKSYGRPVDGAIMTPDGWSRESLKPDDLPESWHRTRLSMRVKWPDPPGPVRALLVYALPTDSSNSIQLKYAKDSTLGTNYVGFHHTLSPKPLVILGEGSALPPKRR